MQLGNDIVDLKIDADIHPRFWERISHPVEKILYPNLSDKTVLWMIWAAKEAAFKAHKQGENAVPYFIPSRWLVDMQPRKVFFGDEEYFINFTVSEEFVLATASTTLRKVDSHIYSGLKELNLLEQNEQARKLRFDFLGVSELQKNEEGIPELKQDGRKIPYSLSHHGRHVAIAVSLS